MSTSDEGPASKPAPLGPASNPCMPAPTGPTPLGTLSMLPREVRDEIYGHVCSTKYYLSSCFDPRRYGKWHTIDLTTLPTVALSKSIRQEYLAVLHAETVFVIHDTAYNGNRTWRRHEIPFIDKIQNMVYIRSLYLGSDEEYDERSFDFSWENKEITEKYAEPLSFFAGTEVLRKSCAIELQNLTPKAMLILESPFIDALDNLTGFKTVTLKLTTFYDEWCPEDAVWYVDGGPSCTDQAAGFWMIVDEMKSTLEQSLGPSVIIEANGEGSILGWELTFHPQDFIVKKNPKANSGSPCSCGLF